MSGSFLNCGPVYPAMSCAAPPPPPPPRGRPAAGALGAAALGAAAFGAGASIDFATAFVLAAFPLSAPAAAGRAPPAPPRAPRAAGAGGVDASFGSAPCAISSFITSRSSAYVARQNGVVPSMFSSPQFGLPQLLYAKYHGCFLD